MSKQTVSVLMVERRQDGIGIVSSASCVASWHDIQPYYRSKVSHRENTENYRLPLLRRGSIVQERPPHCESRGSRIHHPDQKNLIGRVMRGCERQFGHTTQFITVNHPASIVAFTVNRIPILMACSTIRNETKWTINTRTNKPHSRRVRYPDSCGKLWARSPIVSPERTVRGDFTAVKTGTPPSSDAKVVRRSPTRQHSLARCPSLLSHGA